MKAGRTILVGVLLGRGAELLLPDDTEQLT
jgi:hypothetical protein